MELKVIRSVFKPTATFGKMYLDGKFYAYTCEDTVRDLKPDGSGKIRSKTAIDYGKYEVVLSFSNHFQKYLPLLLNVKWFEGIRIHGGNTAEDSLGCILIGEGGDMSTKVWTCASKVNNLVSVLKTIEKKEKMWIEIVKG